MKSPPRSVHFLSMVSSSYAPFHLFTERPFQVTSIRKLVACCSLQGTNIVAIVQDNAVQRQVVRSVWASRVEDQDSSITQHIVPQEAPRANAEDTSVQPSNGSPNASMYSRRLTPMPVWPLKTTTGWNGRDSSYRGDIRARASISPFHRPAVGSLAAPPQAVGRDPGSKKLL